MQCPFCFEKNAAGAKFCSNCGSPLHLRICSRCQAVNDKTARSCTECGSPLPELQEQPEVSTAAEDFSVNKNDSSTQLVAEMKNFHELLASLEKEVSKQLIEVERMSPENNTGLAPRPYGMSRIVPSIDLSNQRIARTIEKKRRIWLLPTLLLVASSIGSVSYYHFASQSPRPSPARDLQTGANIVKGTLSAPNTKDSVTEPATTSNAGTAAMIPRSTTAEEPPTEVEQINPDKTESTSPASIESDRSSNATPLKRDDSLGQAERTITKAPSGAERTPRVTRAKARPDDEIQQAPRIIILREKASDGTEPAANQKCPEAVQALELCTGSSINERK